MAAAIGAKWDQTGRLTFDPLSQGFRQVPSAEVVENISQSLDIRNVATHSHGCQEPLGFELGNQFPNHRGNIIQLPSHLGETDEINRRRLWRGDSHGTRRRFDARHS